MVALLAAACSAQPISYIRGFYPAETGTDGSTHRWMGPAAIVRLANNNGPMVLMMRFNVPLKNLKNKPTLKFTWNGKVLEEAVVEQEDMVKKFQIPAADQASGRTSELRIETSESFVPREVNPESADVRRLGLVMWELTWSPPAAPAK